MNKHILIGTGPDGRVFVTINYQDRRLSITGVVGPMANGDARGSAGQCTDALAEVTDYAEGFDAETVATLADVWQRWHLNDMRPGCEHQRATWDTSAELEIVTYRINSDGHRIRRLAEQEAISAAAGERVPNLTILQRALLSAPLIPHEIPDADSPLSGMYDVLKRETKLAAWVRPDEHPGGLLTKPCEVCGYEYGTRWLKEDVPADVITFLAELPATDKLPAVWAQRNVRGLQR